MLLKNSDNLILKMTVYVVWNNYYGYDTMVIEYMVQYIVAVYCSNVYESIM